MALEEVAQRARLLTVQSIHAAGSGHPGGSLSCVDLLTYLYVAEMRVRPHEPYWPDRDRFVMSKGHAAPTLYAVMALIGYFPEEETLTLRKLGSRLQGKPDMTRLPGIDFSTGSLGIGFSAAVGMAKAAKMSGSKSRVYVLIGDGEMAEGIVWESAMFAGKHELDNLVCIMDANGFGSDGPVENTSGFAPIWSKWNEFGWSTREVAGHEFSSIKWGFDVARITKDQPTFLLARTIKGRGVDYMERKPEWHGSLTLTDDQLEAAVKSIEGEDNVR